MISVGLTEKVEKMIKKMGLDGRDVEVIAEDTDKE